MSLSVLWSCHLDSSFRQTDGQGSQSEGERAMKVRWFSNQVTSWLKNIKWRGRSTRLLTFPDEIKRVNWTKKDLSWKEWKRNEVRRENQLISVCGYVSKTPLCRTLSFYIATRHTFLCIWLILCAHSLEYIRPKKPNRIKVEQTGWLWNKF